MSTVTLRAGGFVFRRAVAQLECAYDATLQNSVSPPGRAKPIRRC